MRIVGALVYMAPFLFGVWCIVCLFRNKRSGLFYQAQRSFGWLALCTAPVALAQVFTGFGRDFGFDDFFERIAVVPGSWFVLLGGQSVITIFEDNVKDWTGHRKDTMFDNAPVFLALTLAQILVFTAIVLWRFRKGKGMRDPVVLGIGIFMAVNAALGMQWMWFGT